LELVRLFKVKQSKPESYGKRKIMVSHMEIKSSAVDR